MTYKEYLKIFISISKMIEFFMKLQQVMEELYISGQIKFDDDPCGDN